MTPPGRTRPARRRHPALRGLEVGVWHPEGVGRVPGYPATPEAYEARRLHLADHTAKARAEGTLTRRGVPNGWAGRKPELEELRRNSQTAAERLAAELLRPDRTDDERRADLAITAVLSIALNASIPMRYRLQAANIALPCLLPKPVRKTVLGASTNRGLDYLEGLAGVLKAARDKA